MFDGRGGGGGGGFDPAGNNFALADFFVPAFFYYKYFCQINAARTEKKERKRDKRENLKLFIIPAVKSQITAYLFLFFLDYNSQFSTYFS